MKFKLTKEAKELKRLIDCGQSIYDIRESPDHPLGEFSEGIIESTDEFWYALTNGYINYERLIADKKQLAEIKKAIAVIKDLEDIVYTLGGE